MNIMEALVTGATGFVGSHVADLLIERGFNVRCIYRKTSNLRWLEGKPVRLFEAPLSNMKALEAAADGVDYVFHVGGLIAAKSYEEFLMANRDGSLNLARAAMASPNLKRFVYVSSLTACGPSKSLSEPLTEDMPPKPLTAYGRSKFEAEKELNKLKNDLPLTIIRPPAVYGPRDPGTFTIFHAVKKGFGFLIGFDKKYLSLVHSSDLARGIVDSAFPDKTIGETYFVSSREFYTWPQIMKAMQDGFGRDRIFNLHVPHFIVMGAAAVSGFIGKFMKKPPIFNYDKGIYFIQKYWICSIDKARRDFGYEPKVELRQGIAETASWYIQNKWL